MSDDIPKSSSDKKSKTKESGRLAARLTRRKDNEIKRNRDGLTFDEQHYWLNRLSILLDKGSRKPTQWKEEVEITLSQHRVFTPLVQRLKKVEVPTIAADEASAAGANELQEALESEIRNTLEVALSFIEAQPITALGYEVRARIREAVYEDIRSIWRWALPILTALIVGGSVGGYFYFGGLVQFAKQSADKAVQKIESQTERVDGFVEQANTGIGHIKDSEKTATATLAKLPSLVQLTDDIERLKDKIQDRTRELNSMTQRLDSMKALVDAREDFNSAVAKMTPDLRQASWIVVLRMALLDNIVLGVVAFAALVSLLFAGWTAWRLRRMRRQLQIKYPDALAA